MTQEQKKLLLKDLCARLPHGVKVCNITDATISSLTLIGIHRDTMTLERTEYKYEIAEIDEVKPYLFPLSRMTEEQKQELSNILNCTICFTDYEIIIPDYNYSNMENWQKIFKWCYENHFDIYGLIPMGLAIDATGLNIY